MNENTRPTEQELQQKAAPTLRWITLGRGLKVFWGLVAIVLGAVGGYLGWCAGHDVSDAVLGTLPGFLFGFFVAIGSTRGCGT
jgi:hypothetical protein